MLDFEVQRCTRRCAKTNRELAPGEDIHSVLISDGSDVRRQDFCVEAWEGPPEEAIGHWKSRMPDANAKKANWAPNDVMLHFFQQLQEQPEKQDIRYILALLMVRRRIVRLEESETDDAGGEMLVVFCPRNDTEYRVPVINPSLERASQIQDELAELLCVDAA